MSEDNSTEQSPLSDTATAHRQWCKERTTFQRVYDVLTGMTEYKRVDAIAERAECSVDGARNALTQLLDMGIATQRGNRPAEFRRNDCTSGGSRSKRLPMSIRFQSSDSDSQSSLTKTHSFKTSLRFQSPTAFPPHDLATVIMQRCMNSLSHCLVGEPFATTSSCFRMRSHELSVTNMVMIRVVSLRNMESGPDE